MSGRKARSARSVVKMLEANYGPLSFEVQHTNVRHRTAPLFGVFTPDGSNTTFSYTTSTHTIPAKRLYRAVKRDIARGVI